MEVNTQRPNTSKSPDAITLQGVAAASKENNAEVSKGIQTLAANMPDAQRKQFMSLVRNPDLAPRSSAQEALNPEVIKKLEAIEVFLSQSSSSDAARLLGRLMVELGAQQRKEALDQRLIARAVARTELEAGADKLRDAASETKKGALISLIITAAASVASAGMSMGALKSSMSAAKANVPAAGSGSGPATQPQSVIHVKPPTAGQTPPPTSTAVQTPPPASTAVQTPPPASTAVQTPPPASTAVQTPPAAPTAPPSAAQTPMAAGAGEAGGFSSKGMAYNTVAGTVSGLGAASGRMASASHDSAAQIDQATQAEFNAEAEVTKSEGELETSEQQALHEFISQIIQFIKELRDAQVEQLAVVTKG